MSRGASLRERHFEDAATSQNSDRINTNVLSMAIQRLFAPQRCGFVEQLAGEGQKMAGSGRKMAAGGQQSLLHLALLRPALVRP